MISNKDILLFNLIFSSIILCVTLHAQDYDFEIPKEEAAKLELNGNLDAKWRILHMNDTSPFYKWQFFRQEEPDEYLSQYQLDFYFNGDYRFKQVGFTMRTFTQYIKEESVDLSLFELYGSLNPSPQWTLSAGKRRFNWGKGYAFNPVGYVNTEKDPQNPDLALAGKLSIFLNYNQSLNSALITNLSLSAIILPKEADILDRFAEFDNTGIAFKLYLLMHNIDLDFMIFTAKNQPQRYGMDFSTNLRENIELHGEISFANDENYNFIKNNSVQTRKLDGFSYLLGLRYLNRYNITFIAEYYHKNRGLSPAEYEKYLDYLHNNLDSADPDMINLTKSLPGTYFRSKNLMEDYFYFKASVPEPFNWLYSSVSVFTIYNINDNSFILSPQIGYKPFTNSEILFWPILFFGGQRSEYGSKQFQKKIEMWFRFYF
jgi:hypothetical protein